KRISSIRNVRHTTAKKYFLNKYDKSHSPLTIQRRMAFLNGNLLSTIENVTTTHWHDSACTNKRRRSSGTLTFPPPCTSSGILRRQPSVPIRTHRSQCLSRKK